VLSHRSGTGCADLQAKEGDEIRFGKQRLRVIETPGHTDGCLTFFEPDAGMLFTGDALLIRGCGRTDFQQGNSQKLYHSIVDKLFSLPDETLVYPGHDYQGQTLSTIGEEKLHNPRLSNKSEAEFVGIMDSLKLAPPKHIQHAVPANLACGQPQVAAPPVLRQDANLAPTGIERSA
jgi:glyoxylase-like metal-dependent hydrolase (beta-lactamase superfamily II)